MARPLVRQAKSLASFTPANLQSHLVNRPVLPLHLPSLTSAWPALTSWQLEDGLQRLREKIGEDRVTEIELGKKGRGYLDKEWQRIHMPFGLFLDAFVFNLIPSSSSAELPTAYLAQSDLLDSTPQLLDDVPALTHFYQGKEKSLYRRTIWVGPNGSFTPFHKDPYVGIYSQIVGRKTFHLLPPDASPYLDLSPIPRHANTSQIPVPVSRIISGGSTNEDVGDLPQETIQKCKEQLEKAFSIPGACQIDVAAGDSVLIPEGWWHAAEGVDGPGVGVNAWFR
ncbi:hypothetical protein AYX13_06044 [Cryptococcus neoformans]|nr:hypothetical protein AYX13_06044 [Cryptococcus neoformans var. grubii]